MTTGGITAKSKKQVRPRSQPAVHAVKIDYYEEFGWAAAHLEWQPEGGERTYALPVRAFKKIPAKKLLSAIQIDSLGNGSEPSPAFRNKIIAREAKSNSSILKAAVPFKS